MLFYLFLSFIQSTLKNGDNPYKILGVSKTATDEEIKSAYRKLTIKYHPDNTKLKNKKEAEKKFVQATDAFELLKDQTRRSNFDRTGSTSEEVNEPHQHQQYYYSNDPEDIFSQFFGFNRGGGNANIDFKTEEITANSMDEMLKKSKELFVFVYSGHDRFYTPQYAKFFEEVADELGGYTKFVRNDAKKGQHFAQINGINTVPSFLYLKLQPDGTIHKSIETSINSREALIKWVEKCWNPKIEYFTNYASFEKWLKQNRDFTRVVSIERGNEAGMDFKQAASHYTKCKFACITDDFLTTIRNLKLTVLPVKLIFRHDKQIKFTTYKALKTLSNPILARLERKSLERECLDFCLIRIGKPGENIINNFTEFTEAPTSWIPASSKFAKAIKAKEGEWYIISGKNRKFTKIDINSKFTEISKFLSNRLNMRTLTCEVDWTLDSLLEAAKEPIFVLLSYLNPLKYIKMLSGVSLDLPIFMLMLFIIFPLLSKCLNVAV